MSKTPIISVVIPTFNEIKYIEGTIYSILDQQCVDFDIEILVVDGGSNDGTKKVVESISWKEERVKLLLNPKKRTPYALNIGIENSTGEYILIAGAHSLYPANYLRVCLGEMLKNDAIGCSGKIVTKAANNTLSAKLCSWVTAHPFGTSRNSFRNMKAGFSFTLPRAVYRKGALLEVGLYNEKLFRNQDNDINQRLIGKGYKLFYTWETNFTYYAKDSIKSLLRFSFSNGSWNVLSFIQNSKSMRPYHFAPLAFVILLIFLFLLTLFGSKMSFQLLLALLVTHLLMGFLAAAGLFITEKSTAVFCTPIIFLLFHLTYGAGSLVSLSNQIFMSLKNYYYKKILH